MNTFTVSLLGWDDGQGYHAVSRPSCLGTVGGRATLGQLVESSEVIALALEARIAAASAPVLLGEAACSR